MNKDYYKSLGVWKSATEAEIKKAYKKLAMQYHPDRNKGDKKAEEKFKEINEAYQVLWDTEKRKNYDQFGSADFSGFWSWGFHSGGNPFWWGMGGGFDFWDIFSQFSWMGQWQTRQKNQWFEFDFWDMFGEAPRGRKPETQAKEEINLDVIETVEIPFFDFLYDTSVSVKTVYGKHLTLKVKSWTKPGTKFRIAGKWRTQWGKTGDMYVIVDAKMPKDIPASIQPMIDAIRYQV